MEVLADEHIEHPLNDLVVANLEEVTEHSLLCVNKEQQKRLIDACDVDAPLLPKVSSTGSFQIPRRIYYLSFFLLWTILFGLAAASISFWIPVVLLPNSDSIESINITSAVQNVIGAFVFGIVRSCRQVKYQYRQTYFIYKGIMCGFCSVFTTFANVVADTGRLLLTGNWYAAPANIAMNLILSIIAYEIGRQIARKLRKDVKFSDDTMKLENSDMRMHLEIEKQLLRDTNEGINSQSGSNSVFLDHGDNSIGELEDQRAKLAARKLKHINKWPKWGHYVAMGFLLTIIILNFIAVVLFAVYDERMHSTLPPWFPNASNAYIVTDFVMYAGFSVVGAILGSALSGGKYNMMRSVQWGTFRVNMISCICIGCVNNITLFGGMLSLSTFLSITFYRFVVGFCGSFSSFAGLIDETVVLWHGHTWKRRWNSLRNLFYNFFVCLFMYILIILVVRLAIFLRYWSPATAVFLCGSISLWSCFAQ